jgi:hypothetical protein
VEAPLSNDVTLPKLWIDKQDVGFFFDHPDRHARIRKPFGDEMKGEFWSLGEHEKDRRRVLLWRVPEDNPYYSRDRSVLKIPMLLFGDETVEDRDDILLPMIHEIMSAAREKLS